MRSLIFVLLVCLSAASYADPAIAIIGNQEGDLGNLTRKQVVDIYMGRTSVLANGAFPVPVDYQGNIALRERFYQLMTGKSLAQINAYWARMSFTGQSNPARMLSDPKAMLRAVGKNPDALGYVEKNEVSTTVKTLLTIE
ncbi:MAG: hypothetical protein ACXW1C_01410 [Gallionella sp.]